jgi:hypothetical protein
MAQNFGIIANHAEKAKSATTEGVKLLEGRVAEPETKKLRVGASGEDTDAAKKGKTMAA